MSDVAVPTGDALQLRTHRVGEASHLYVLGSREVDRQREHPLRAAASAPNLQRVVRSFHARYFATAPHRVSMVGSLIGPAYARARRKQLETGAMVGLPSDVRIMLGYRVLRSLDVAHRS
jgi:hypothetical protein